jgi:hypothetical protein
MTLITGVLRLLTTWGLICIQGGLLNKSGNILGMNNTNIIDSIFFLSATTASAQPRVK